MQDKEKVLLVGFELTTSRYVVQNFKSKVWDPELNIFRILGGGVAVWPKVRLLREKKTKTHKIPG